MRGAAMTVCRTNEKDDGPRTYTGKSQPVIREKKGNLSWQLARLSTGHSPLGRAEHHPLHLTRCNAMPHGESLVA